jgi:NTE family protein
MLRPETHDDYRPSLLLRVLRERFAGDRSGIAAFLEAGAQYRTLAPREFLMHEGETGDDVYVVLSGRLRAQTGASIVGEIGRGEAVGEIAFFTGAPRSASIVALRRTIVARLSRELIERAVAREPAMAFSLTRQVIERFRTDDGVRKRPVVPVMVCVLPISPGVDARAFAEALRAQQPGSVRSIAIADAASAECRSPDLASRRQEHFSRYLTEVEEEHAAAYLVADPADALWTKACLAHADEVLLLADAKADPALSAVEASLLSGDGATLARQTLVLLHDEQTQAPRGTARWLVPRGRPRHFHIRPHLSADMARMARILSGRAVGLVLAGGGARGFAHIGVYQAIEEAGIPVDFIGGTSIGALMGTLVALDVRGVEMERGVREGFLHYKGGNITGDYNLLPMLSLLRGKRSRDSLADSVQRFAGHDIDMEDSWKSFFVMAGNFSYGREDVLDTGPLVPNVTASFSIPGALPPVLLNGNLMFDGGTFNNFPTDVMARMGVGRIIGVDVSGDLKREIDEPETPSPLALLFDRMLPRSKQRYSRLPSLPETMLLSTFITSIARQREQRQYADLLFRPELPRMRLLDWSRFDDVVEAGRSHARKVIAALGESVAEYR